MEKGNYEDAVKSFDLAIKAGLNNEDAIYALNNKGVSLFQLGRFDEAAECFDEAIRTDSSYPDPWINKGAYFYQIKKYDDAIRCFDRALRKNLEKDQRIRALNNKGASLFQLGKFNESIESYRAALQEQEDYDIYNNLALSLVATGQLEEAKHYIDLAPEDDSTLDTKGFVYYNLGCYERSLEYLTSAIGKNSNCKYAYYHKGDVQLELKNYSDAMRCYDKAIGIDPGFAEAYNAKAIVLSHMQKRDEALNAVKKAIEINPALSSAHENLVKLILPIENKGRQNFWDFWSGSKTKKLVATILVVLSVGIIIYYPVVSYYYGGIIFPEIPESYLIVIGLMILILLMPEIKKAKLGPIEFELSDEIIFPEPISKS